MAAGTGRLHTEVVGIELVRHRSNDGGSVGSATTSSFRRVLVVEDDDSMREALERLLRAAGFEPAAYPAAENLLSSDPGPAAVCVVSDLKLPGMSGLELLAELGARGWGLPLILITAHDVPGLREEVLRRGAAAYLVKPFSGAALLEAITAESAPPAS